MDRLYAIDSKELTKRPEIRIGDKMYEVDDRMITFEKMNVKLSADESKGKEFDIIINLALGEKSASEIYGMELSFSAMQKIVILIMAAIQDITEQEAQKRFRTSYE